MRLAIGETVLGRLSKSQWVSAFVLAIVLVVTSPSLFAWKEVLKERAIEGVEGITETRWQLERPRGDARDRIQVHRYRGSGAARAALLYLPGMHMNGYLPGRRGEVIYADPTEAHNLWLFLARHGVEVFTLDYRSHFVPVEPADHAFMREWTLERYVDDAKEALSLVRGESERAQVFVAGFSMGVTLAYGVVNITSKEELAGLIVLDGSFKQPPGGRSFDRARAMAMIEKLGRWSIDVAGGIGWDNRQQLMETIIIDPNQPREDRPDETVGERLTRLLARRGRGTWANVGVHSDAQVLAALLIGYDRYFPTMVGLQSGGVSSLENDPTTAVDDAFGHSDVPVIYFGATGFGPQALLSGIYSAARLGTRDVTIHVQEGWGHLEVLVANRARQEIYERLLDWLDAHAVDEKE
ncbi:MAG: alpha/beta hydrolase [Pseudomonadales bacterium]